MSTNPLAHDDAQVVPTKRAAATCSGRTLDVVHHSQERFYELLEDGASVGMLIYERSPSQTSLTHALIREDQRGRGLGSTLIASALDDLVGRGTTLVARCDSVARFLANNADYQSRVRTDVGRQGHATDH